MKDINGTEIKVGDFIIYAAVIKCQSIPELKYAIVTRVGVGSWEITIHTGKRVVDLNVASRIAVVPRSFMPEARAAELETKWGTY